MAEHWSYQAYLQRIFQRINPGTTLTAPKLAADAPAYSLINIGNFGYWQKYDAYSAHTPSGSGGIHPREPQQISI